MQRLMIFLSLYGVCAYLSAETAMVNVTSGMTAPVTTAVTAASIAPTAAGMSSENIFKLMFMLFIVLALIVTAAWLMKRFTRITGHATGAIRIIAQAPMGVKERVVLLQVGEEQLLVGQSLAGLQTLHVLQTPVSAERCDVVRSFDFANTLKAVIKR